MNDYIFPRASLVALLAVAGTTANVNAAFIQVDHVGNFNFRVEIEGATAGLYSSVFEDGRHLTVDEHSIDAFGTGELESSPLYVGDETIHFNPLATGGVPNIAPITEITLTKIAFHDHGGGENSISMDMFIFDSAGGVYSSTERLRLSGAWLQDGRRDHSMSMILQADLVFSNGGDTDWILEAGSNLRLVGLPTPATWTPLMAGLVAVARRPRNRDRN